MPSAQAAAKHVATVVLLALCGLVCGGGEELSSKEKEVVAAFAKLLDRKFDNSWENAFAHYDGDGSGGLDVSEAKGAVYDAGVRAPPACARAVSDPPKSSL
eukprot:COSAG05_NODE_3925_length_1772_cov_34.933652_2_plen_101_part_00